MTLRNPLISIPKWTAVALVLFFFIGSFFSAWADRKAIANPESAVHVNPDELSEVIGIYHERTTITIADESEGKWYRVIFPRLMKGFPGGWIKKESLEGFMIYDPNGKLSKSEPEKPESPFKRPPIYFGLIAEMHEISPVEAQSMLGEKLEGFFSPSFDLEFGRRLSQSISGFLRVGYYSFTRDSSVAAASYFAKGYTVFLGTDWFFYTQPSFDIGLGIGLGYSVNEAGNTAPDSTGREISHTTTGVMAPTAFIRIVADKALSRKFGFRVMLGYRTLRVNDVPVSPIATSLTSASTNFSLDGVFAGLALNFLF